jgi:hypothetical protein
MDRSKASRTLAFPSSIAICNRARRAITDVSLEDTNGPLSQGQLGFTIITAMRKGISLTQKEGWQQWQL